MNNKNPSTLRLMYLDYFNDFLSVSAFAEYYEVSALRASRIISAGRAYNNIPLLIDYKRRKRNYFLNEKYGFIGDFETFKREG